MSEAHLTRRSVIGLAAAVVGGVVVQPAWAGTAAPDGAVVSWINRNAVRLPRTDVHGPLHDLGALRHIVGDGQVVGIGESAHGTHEQFTLKHRAARFLVEQMGFRTIAWEENWATGVAVDRYVVGGEGDPKELLADAGALWRSEEMLDLVCWMRAFNHHRRDGDKVRFLGTDLVQLRRLAFDEITRYVGDVAPGRLAELEGHLAPIRLRGTPGEHIGWYTRQPDKQPLIAHARAVRGLVRGLPSGPSQLGREDVLQHARMILGFYEYYATQVLDVRDHFMADTLGWWQQRTQHRVVYWAANVHTAANPRVTYGLPPFVPQTEAVVTGSHLRQRYGRRYVSIGTVFHTGEILTGWETGAPSVFAVPPPGPGMVDRVLGRARYRDYLLDLRADASHPVQRWLAGSATMRLIGSAYDAEDDAAYAMSVDSWRDGFDAVLHLGRTTAIRLLT